MSRIQRGSLRLRPCINKPSFWQFRFRVNEGGRPRLKAVRLGTVEELPSKAAAWAKARKVAPVIEENEYRPRSSVLGDLIERFIAEEHLQEIVAGNYKKGDGLKYSTA